MFSIAPPLTQSSMLLFKGQQPDGRTPKNPWKEICDGDTAVDHWKGAQVMEFRTCTINDFFDCFMHSAIHVYFWYVRGCSSSRMFSFLSGHRWRGPNCFRLHISHGSQIKENSFWKVCCNHAGTSSPELFTGDSIKSGYHHSFWRTQTITYRASQHESQLSWPSGMFG